MAERTVLTKNKAPGGYDSGGAALVWTAADVDNKNRFLATGREILLVRNENEAAQTVTITAVDDPFKRKEDASKELAIGSVAPTFAVFQMFPTIGWQQSDGYIYLEAAAADVYFAVIELP